MYVFALIISIVALAISAATYMRTVRLTFAKRCHDVRVELLEAKVSLVSLKEKLRDGEGDEKLKAVALLSKWVDVLESTQSSLSQMSQSASNIWWLPEFTSFEERLEKTAGDAAELRAATREAWVYFEHGNFEKFLEFLDE